MNLKVNGKDVKFFNEFEIGLKYDSSASTFSCNGFFNPENPDHKAIFKPYSFNTVEVFHNGELLITGTLLSNRFQSSASPQLVSIGGYSLPGILDDCEIPVSLYPLQDLNISLKQIAQRLIKPFGLKMVIDSSVASKMDRAFKSSTADEKQSIHSYLASKAAQKNVVLSHTAKGELLFTEADTKQQPVINFDRSIPGISFVLSTNGQMVHSNITVIKGVDEDGGNAGQSSISNPYSSKFRTHVRVQSSGTDSQTSETAKAILAEELKSIVMTVKMDRWDVDGKIIRPNSIITVLDPDLYLYKRTKFFVESVDLSGNESEQTATLTCYLPEVYNNQTPVNIFT